MLTRILVNTPTDLSFMTYAISIDYETELGFLTVKFRESGGLGNLL